MTKLIPEFLRFFLKAFFSQYSVTASQAGQDYWIYGEAFNEKREGYFLDIGAHDGVVFSNTYILEKRYRWNGICIEANPNTFIELKRNRRSVCLNICLDQDEGEVDFILRGVMGGIVDRGLDNAMSDNTTDRVIRLETRSLINVLDEHQAPSTIDYLSIDVEGAEERILAEFDFEKYIFRAITVERPTRRLRTVFENNGYICQKEIPDLDCFLIHNTYLEEYRRNLFEFYLKKHVRMRWR